MRKRILISVAFGVASGVFCWALHLRLHQGAGDLTFALRLAQNLLSGGPLYATPMDRYPVTAGILILPLVGLKPEIAAGVFIGLSTALLAFGLTRGGYTRLLIFLAYPYWSALLWVQWSPLVMAAAFFPLLLPLTLAKPQIGLPVALPNLTWRGVAGCAALLLVSIAFRPGWPPHWFRQVGYYNYFIPLVVFPGLLLLLALSRRDDPDTYLLLTAALMPQRWFYDTFILWLIPKDRREILATAALSWCTEIIHGFHTPRDYAEVGQWTVLWIYLPMLFVLLLRPMTAAPGPAQRPKAFSAQP